MLHQAVCLQFVAHAEYHKSGLDKACAKRDSSFFLKHAAHTTNQSSALCVHKAETSYQYLHELATRTTSRSAALLQVTRQAALAKPVPDMPRLAKATPTLAHIRRAFFST